MIIISGPCSLESYQHGIDSALYLKEFFDQYPVDFYFKTSFTKANRTSGDSPRGAGIDTLLAVWSYLNTDNRSNNGHFINMLTDVHEVDQVEYIVNSPALCETHFDLALQIPALLSRQTDLINAAANTGKIVNIKKGQFMSPHDMKHAKEKAKNAKEVWLTERGTSFGYNNLVVDFRSLVIMSEENPDAKIIFDCTHSTQLPGASGKSSGGERKFALPLAKAAVAVGVDGLFFETHEAPDSAPSDGDVMLPWSDLKQFMDTVMK